MDSTRHRSKFAILSPGGTDEDTTSQTPLPCAVVDWQVVWTQSRATVVLSSPLPTPLRPPPKVPQAPPLDPALDVLQAF